MSDSKGRFILTYLWYIFQVLVVSTLVYYLTRSVALLDIDNHHDGIILKPALDVLSGKMLFRDTFTQYGAFLTLIHAWLLQAFGPYLYVLRLATVWVYVLTAVLMWILWKQFMPSIFASLTVVVWILLAGFYDTSPDLGVLLIWSSVYALPFIMGGALLILLWLRKQNPLLLFGAGTLFALAFWIRQNTGIYMLCAWIVFIAIARWKKIALGSTRWFWVGTGIVHMAFVTWLIANGAFIYWFKDSILFAYQWQKSVSAQDRFPIFFITRLLPVSLSALSVWVLLPSACVLQGYILLKKKVLGPRQRGLLWMSILGVWCWLQYYPMSDAQHTFWDITPVVGMYIYTAVYPPVFKKYRILFFMIACILLIPDTFLRARMWKHKITRYQYYSLPEIPLFRSIQVREKDYIYYTNLVRTIHRYERAYPGICIHSASPNAINTLLGKRSCDCSRYSVDWQWNLYSPSIESVYRPAVVTCIAKNSPLVVAKDSYWQPKEFVRVTPLLFGRDYLMVPERRYLAPQ